MLHDLKHAYRMLMRTKGWTVVVLLSLAAGYLPARRAARVDPMVALRYE